MQDTQQDSKQLRQPLKKREIQALMGAARLGWLGITLQREGLPVRFLVRAHAWVVGSVPGWGTNMRQLTDVSLFLPPFPSLSKNK